MEQAKQGEKLEFIFKPKKRILEEDEKDKKENDPKQLKEDFKTISTITLDTKENFKVFSRILETKDKNIIIRSDGENAVAIHDDVFFNVSTFDRTRKLNAFKLNYGKKHLNSMVDYMYTGNLKIVSECSKYLESACILKLDLLIAKLVPLVAEKCGNSLLMLAAKYPDRILLTEKIIQTVGNNLEEGFSCDAFVPEAQKILDFIKKYSKWLGAILRLSLFSDYVKKYEPDSLVKFLQKNKEETIDRDDLTELVDDTDEFESNLEKILDTIDFSEFSEDDLGNIVSECSKRSKYSAFVYKKIIKRLFELI